MGTEELNPPFASVTVPTVDPLINTEAFRIGVPFSSVTWPVTVRDWANEWRVDNRAPRNGGKNFSHK